MVAVAVSLFLAFSSSVYNLEKSCDTTYKKLKFLDFYISLRGAGSAAVAQIQNIPGVLTAVGRRVVYARILISGGETNARVVGVPVETRPEVNDLFIHEGRYLESARGEALLERRFAEAHHIAVGDRIALKLRYSDPTSFTVVGLVTSPEFIWLADNRLDPRPAARRLAVVFVSQNDANSVAGQSGINDIQVRLKSPEYLSSAMAEARSRLVADLVDDPVARADQASNSLLMRDRKAFAGVAVLFPLIFLALSTMTLLATLWQLVVGQRKLVGVMMATGISDSAIVGHYLFLCCVVSGLGGLAGIILGHPLGILCTRYYADSLGLPLVITDFYPGLALVALAVTLLAAVVTGWRATGRLLNLEPAEVLRVEFAPVERVPRLERFFPFLSGAGYILRLPLRNVLRHPLRNLGVVCSLAISVAVLLMALTFYDSERNTLEFFFQKVHRYDLQVDLVQPTSPAALPAFALWPGVNRAEFFLRQAVHLTGGKEVDRNVWGVPPDSQMVNNFDANRQPVAVSDDGLALMGPLPMKTLGVRPGSTLKLRIDTPQMQGRETTVVVGKELFEPVSNPPKLTLAKLQQIMAQGTAHPRDGVNIVLFQIDQEQVDSIRNRLYASPFVAEVTDFHAYKEDVRVLLRLANAYFGLMAVFSGLLAFALLMASSTMTVADRSSEIATLAVLGLGERLLAAMLMMETLILWAGAMILGVPGGYLLGNWLLNHYQSDLIQMDLNLSLQTIVATTLGSLILCLLANLYSLSQVLRIPLSDATRSAS